MVVKIPKRSERSSLSNPKQSRIRVSKNSFFDRGVTTNSGLGEPGSNRDLFCIVSKEVV